jgi:hypothetical protein
MRNCEPSVSVNVVPLEAGQDAVGRALGEPVTLAVDEEVLLLDGTEPVAQGILNPALYGPGLGVAPAPM